MEYIDFSYSPNNLLFLFIIFLSSNRIFNDDNININNIKKIKNFTAIKFTSSDFDNAGKKHQNEDNILQAVPIKSKVRTTNITGIS
ncbi:MAG: hypothetical protein ACTSU4_08495 [Promethearchaeota archaeon]